MILQDEAVFVLMKTSLSVDAIKRLDLKAFRSLYESVRRIESQRRIEEAWTSMVATNGTGEKMSDLLRKLGLEEYARIQAKTEKQASNGLRDLMRVVGSGF